MQNKRVRFIAAQIWHSWVYYNERICVCLFRLSSHAQAIKYQLTCRGKSSSLFDQKRATAIM